MLLRRRRKRRRRRRVTGKMGEVEDEMWKMRWHAWQLRCEKKVDVYVMSTQTVRVNELGLTVIILNFCRTQLLINSFLGLNFEINHTFRTYSVIIPIIIMVLPPLSYHIVLFYHWHLENIFVHPFFLQYHTIFPFC